MKIKNLLLLIIALMPMELMAQSDIGLSVSYLPSDTTILIHIANNADKTMRIRNDDGSGSGSLVQFHLKDKAGKEISLYDAAFFEGIYYQRFIDINEIFVSFKP